MNELRQTVWPEGCVAVAVVLLCMAAAFGLYMLHGWAQ